MRRRSFALSVIAGPLAIAAVVLGQAFDWARSDGGTSTDFGESVAVDGRTLPEPREEQPSSSALLSAELETFSRDRVYEAAVRAA